MRIAAKNTGQANFAVEVLDAGGELQDLPFNAIGAFSGSAISQVITGNGPYFLDVISDGTWSVAVRSP